MCHLHQFYPDTKDSMVKARNLCVIMSNLSIAVARVGMVLRARETTGSIETFTTLRGLWYNSYNTNIISLCVCASSHLLQLFEYRSFYSQGKRKKSIGEQSVYESIIY